MKNKLLIFFLLSNFWQMAFGTVETVIWKGVYYNGIPNDNNVSAKYCQDHTPGTFVHSVKKVLAEGIKTDKNIRLDHGTFHEEHRQGLYFITGELLSHGKTGDKEWEDHIHYYLYKLTEYGITKGVWTTGECKGLYVGSEISKRKV